MSDPERTADASSPPPADGAGPARRPLSELAGTLSGLAAQLSGAAATTARAEPARAEGGPDTAEVRRRVRESQAKQAGMMDNLIRSLDIAAYCQMSVLYYMDNSLALLLLRLLPHWLFYTPKPSFFPPPPTRRPYVLASAMTTGAAVLAHTVLDNPAAGEATRGYLHGGFLIDFVGEAGPVGTLRLLAADLAVLILQLVLLAVVLEREKLRSKMGGGPQAAAAAETGTGAAEQDAPGAQDHDAEEQGVRRDDVENQRLMDEDSARAGDGEAYVATDGPVRVGKHHLDELYSGRYVVANLYVFDAVRRSWWWNYDR